MSGTYTCPVCLGHVVEVFLETPEVPVFCNQLCHSREEALNASVAIIRLGFCASCGHLFNVAFDSSLLEYSPDYENSLHFSPYFQGYADNLARKLTDRYKLKDKTIVEIGCGRGDFLKSLCCNGVNKGFGFDPSYSGSSKQKGSASSVIISNQSYTEFNANIGPDLICCRHCLEHIDQPRALLDTLRITLRGACNDLSTDIFFEVPNALFTLKGDGIWDIIYEHCGYFTASSLAYVFVACGFQVDEVEETFGQQFLTLYGTLAGNNTKSAFNEGVSIQKISDYVVDFSSRYREKIEYWQTFLSDAKQTDQRIVVWSAGSKGNTFLNVLKDYAAIDYVVDINPRKQGKYIAGTGQKIVPPEFLQGYRPDTILLMNPLYREEVLAMCAEINVSADIVSP